MDLSIITVTWNSRELIGEQIKSVRLGCKNISYEQIVADNASTDDAVQMLEKEFDAVVIPGQDQGSSGDLDSRLRGNDSVLKVIKNNYNTGFSLGNNQGAKISSGEFLLFLNPDMRVEEGSLDKMIAWMRAHSDVGLASCKLVDENGKLNEDAQPRRLPGVIDQAAIILKLPHLFPKILDHYMYKGFDADKEQEVESVRGSFMMMRRAVYEKMGFAFDPRYFIWFEDVDTCREVKKLGYKVVHTPVVSCVDYVGQSFKKRTTVWKQKQFTKSMVQYFRKWEPWYKWMFIAALRPMGIGMAWVNDKIKK